MSFDAFQATPIVVCVLPVVRKPCGTDGGCVSAGQAEVVSLRVAPDWLDSPPRASSAVTAIVYVVPHVSPVRVYVVVSGRVVPTCTPLR